MSSPPPLFKVQEPVAACCSTGSVECQRLPKILAATRLPRKVGSTLSHKFAAKTHDRKSKASITGAQWGAEERKASSHKSGA